MRNVWSFYRPFRIVLQRMWRAVWRSARDRPIRDECEISQETVHRMDGGRCALAHGLGWRSMVGNWVPAIFAKFEFRFGRVGAAGSFDDRRAIGITASHGASRRAIAR